MNFHLDSNCQQDSGFLELNHRFQSPGFQILQVKLFQVPDSTDQKFPGFGMSYFTLGEIIQDEITGSNASVTNNAESLNRQLKVIARR